MKNSIRYIICAAFFTALLFVGAHASTSSAVYMQYYCTYYSNIYPNLNAAYRAPEGEGFVDGITGSLCTNTVDYRIKGKNGFDIPITRIFKTATSSDDVYYDDCNNKKSVPAYYYAYYTCSEDGETVMITFYNEKELYEADPSFEGVEYSKKSENKYSSLKRNGTGIYYTRVDGRETEVVYKDSYYVYGASIMYSGNAFTDICDTMQIIKPAMYVYDYDNDSDSRDLELVFQDINGNSCTLSAYYRKKNGVFRLHISTYQMASYSKYKLTAVDDNDANVTAVHPLGFSYNTTVTSDDGETYYFLMENFRTYKICGVSDRYGNAYTITDDTYAYIITTSDGEVYTCNSSGITKTAGDTVTQLVLYSRQTVNSAKDVNNKYTIDDEYIFTVTRNSGTSPLIAEDEENVIKYYMRQEYRYDKLLNKLDVAIYKLPYKIEFPTGLTKQIEYSSAIGWEIGYPWERPLTSGYYYCVNRYYEQSGEEIKNEECYAYTFAYNTSHPKYRYISQTEKKSMSGGDDVGAETSYMSFDKRINRIEMRDTLAHISGWHKYEYRNDYSDAKVSEETMSQSSRNGSAGAVREYIYNRQNEVSQITNGDYVCDYTYHSDAGDTYLLKDTQYKKDAATTVRTENVLTEDKKSIAAQNTYENDELKRTVSYTYDSYGNVASESVDLGSDTALTEYSYAYAADGGYTLTKTQKNIKNSDGESVDNIVTVTVYDSEHRPVSQTDAKGGITSMTYDMSGRLLSVSYPDGTSESYSYDTANNIVTCTAKNGTVYKIYFNAWGSRTKTAAVLNGAETVLDEYAYNDMGFVSSYKRYTAPGEYTEARYTHDCTGNVLSEKVYETDGTLLREISYRISISEDSKYNPVTTVTRSISGGGTDFAQYSESTDYLGNIIKRKYTSGANERTYTYTYDLAGNALTETDPIGSVTATAYDVFHNPVSVTYADGSQVSYEYNDLNLVTQKTDALGNISRYEYDAAGRLLNEYNPLADNAEMQSKTDYDANGNVISKKTKTGSMSNNVVKFVGTEYSYDSMNRLAYSFVAPDTNQKLYTVYSYNSAGNPVSITTRTGSLTNTSSDRVTDYTYDSLGRMTGETAPDGKTKSYEYDLQGRKLKITDAANVQDIYTYDAFDNVTSRTRGGESVTYAYNAIGKRTSMTDSTGTSTYTYNPFGELTAENKDDILKSYSYEHVIIGTRKEKPVDTGVSELVPFSFS